MTKREDVPERDPGQRSDSIADSIGDIVGAATDLAENAAEAATDLAEQAVRDARAVARSFEMFVDAVARDGAEIVRDTMEALREAADRAEQRTRYDAMSGYDSVDQADGARNRANHEHGHTAP